MRYSFVILLLTTALVGCGDEYYGVNGNGNGGSYALETEPSLSPDRAYIYYISSDTAYDRYNGIFRTSVASPIREKIFHGEGYHSPTIGFDNNTVAYLESGQIRYFRISDMTGWQSNFTDVFESIIFIHDSILLANRHDTLWQVQESEELLFRFPHRGWDPTLVTKDTFVCFAGEDLTYHIIKHNVYSTRPETLHTITTSGRPRWPTYDPQSGRLAYCIEMPGERRIYSAEDTPIFIDSSSFSKPYILNWNLIIFTGPDGRFYQSDFYGTKSVPFIFVGD